MFHPLLELNRATIAERRVLASAVIIQLDILEDRSAGLGAGTPLAWINQLHLQGGEKALRHCVVPAVCPPAHTANHVMLVEHLPVLVTGILTAAIRMMQQSQWWLPLLNGNHQRIPRELQIDPFAQRKAHYPAG